MPTDAFEFIKLGKQICEDTTYNEEARCRNMINRIYYGVLHFLIWEMGIIVINKERFHKEAIQKINKNDSSIGSYLLKMQKFRNTADYYLDQIVDKRTVDRFMLFYEIIIPPYE